jgi:branched-chain amino acid transport system permease protein
MNLVNFGYGTFAIIASYLCYTLFRAGVNPFITIIPLFIFLGILGIFLEKFIFYRVKNANYQVMVTMAMSMIVVGILLQLYTATPINILIPLTYQYFNVGDFLQIWAVQLYGAIASVAMLSGLHLFLQKTQTGRAIRAVADDEPTALLMGIDSKRIHNLTAFLSFGFAAVAGVFLVMMYSLIPESGGDYNLIAFIICVFGGLGSIKGALLGGLVIGELQILISYYVGPWTKFVSLFIVFIITLLIRPTGLFGLKRA